MLLRGTSANSMLDRCVGLSIYNKTALILGPLCNEDCRATTFVACRNHLNASCALAALTLRHSVENRFPATTIEGKCCRYIPALRRHCYETIMVRRPMDKPAKQSNRISCTPRHNRARTTPPQPQPRHNNHNHGTTTTSTPQQPHPRHNNHNHATTTTTTPQQQERVTRENTKIGSPPTTTCWKSFLALEALALGG